MLEILKFIFSSFWIWLGAILLILAIGTSINAILCGFRGKFIKLNYFNFLV